ncbi:lipase member H-like [Pectinophora gossypiella]|uniref:lipase member H-like n=1 Tax=Pectinophora gossypiella TaxID=13191 RepID=UPI00214E2D9A|nr:lipase member H-like [Pectinophora gossypiella]
MPLEAYLLSCRSLDTMKWAVVALFIAASSASVLKVSPERGYQDGARFFHFPGDGDGIVHLVDLEEPVDVDYVEQYTRNPDNNAYWLFTRANPTVAQILLPNNANSVINSNFNFGRVTVFLAHGWNGNGRNSMSLALTQAFLENGDVNVIVLDWNRLANRNYATAKNGVPAVGRGLGQFINWLVGLGASYDRMHLVGFSLGGHLVGNAGRETGGRVRRITALDPAGPLWTRDNGRIVETDGRYVEVMHTNTGLYGYTDPCGDADFYPNGGSSMPGCWINSCSHSRAHEYMAATVRYNHLLGRECATLRDAQRDRCTGDWNPMGNSDLNKSWPGIFRGNTGRSYPF